jgi:hypothetical protein
VLTYFPSDSREGGRGPPNEVEDLVKDLVPKLLAIVGVCLQLAALSGPALVGRYCGEKQPWPLGNPRWDGCPPLQSSASVSRLRAPSMVASGTRG